MLGSIKKELAAVKTAGDKSRAAVAVNTEELNAVKTPLRHMRTKTRVQVLSQSSFEREID